MTELRLVLLLFIAFAACLGSPANPPEASASPSDFEKCDFAYPDGRAIPCQNAATPAELKAEPPAGWVCVSRDPNNPPSWRFFRNMPVGGGVGGIAAQVGFLFDVGSNNVGALSFMSGESTTFANWSSSTGTAFFRIPHQNPSNSASFYLDVYRFSLESESLNGARLSQYWSERVPGEFWIIHRVDHGDRTLYLQRMTNLGGSAYVTGDIQVDVPEIGLKIQSTSLLRTGSTVRLDNALGC